MFNTNLNPFINLMNARNILFSLLCLLTFQISFAQRSTKNQTTTPIVTGNTSDNQFGLKEKIFRDALKYGDLTVAKQALYEMIALKPSDKGLKDSLAYIYINMGSLREAILLSREILESDASNTNILEVKAIAEQNLGLAKEALADYEILYSKLKNVYHLYQIATLQYDLKRMQECNTSLDQILTSAEVDKKEIGLGTGTRGQQQKVILKAAALNIKGVLAMDLNENAIAKVCFEEALKLTPDFVLAKNNQDFLLKKTAPGSTSTPKTTKK